MSAKALADSLVCAGMNQLIKLSFFFSIHRKKKTFTFEVEPPSSSMVAPGSPNASISSDVKNWLLPSKCVISRPLRMDPSDILHPGKWKMEFHKLQN